MVLFREQYLIFTTLYYEIMPYDPLSGKIRKKDFLGHEISSKEYKKEIMANNRRKGLSGEYTARMDHILNGEFVERTGRGSDFRVYSYDLNQNRMIHKYDEEVKTGRSPLSPLQRETQKRLGKKYKVRRYNDDDILI